MCARVRACVLWRGLSTSARELGRRPVHTGRVTALLLGGEGLQFRFLLSLASPWGVSGPLWGRCVRGECCLHWSSAQGLIQSGGWHPQGRGP